MLLVASLSVVALGTWRDQVKEQGEAMCGTGTGCALLVGGNAPTPRHCADRPGPSGCSRLIERVFRLVLNVSEDALAITQSGPYRAANPQETQVRIIHPKAHEQNK